MSTTWCRTEPCWDEVEVLLICLALRFLCHSGYKAQYNDTALQPSVSATGKWLFQRVTTLLVLHCIN